VAFQTFSYFVFLAVMTAGYFVLPVRMRWALLLAGSCFFYMCWNASYALLMLLSTAVTYLCGIALGRVENQRAKKACVAAVSRSIFSFFSFSNTMAFCPVRSTVCRAVLCF